MSGDITEESEVNEIHKKDFEDAKKAFQNFNEAIEDLKKTLGNGENYSETENVVDEMSLVSNRAASNYQGPFQGPFRQNFPRLVPRRCWGNDVCYDYRLCNYCKRYFERGTNRIAMKMTKLRGNAKYLDETDYQELDYEFAY